MKRHSYRKGIGNTYHAQRSYENNLFPKKRMSRKFLFVASVLSLAALGWGTHSLLRMPFMQIEAVRVYGLETMDAYPVEVDLYESLSSDQFLGIPRTNILRRQVAYLEDQLPMSLFASIDISRTKKVIEIFVEEQAQGSLVHAEGRWSLYSLKGEFIRDLNEEELDFVSKRINQQEITEYLFYRDTPIIELGNQDWETANLEAALVSTKSMHDELLRNGHGVSLHIFKDPYFLWAEAVMNDGYRLYYDLERGVGAQVEQLNTVLRERDSEANPSIIDVRFNGRVFVQ